MSIALYMKAINPGLANNGFRGDVEQNDDTALHTFIHSTQERKALVVYDAAEHKM